jgi:hypothetical protein
MAHPRRATFPIYVAVLVTSHVSKDRAQIVGSKPAIAILHGTDMSAAGEGRRAAGEVLGLLCG